MANTPTTDMLPLTRETPAMQTASDTFNAFLNAPVTKLDADEYMAIDLYGVTEGLAGSGNMNFLMMQAGQTNEMLSSGGGINILGDSALFDSPLMAANNIPALAAGISQTDIGPVYGNETGFTAIDGNGAAPQSVQFSQSFGTASSTSASSTTQSLSNDTAHFSGLTSSTTSGVQTAINGSNGSNGGSGLDGTNGNNGQNGNNDGGGDTTIITNNSVTNNTTNITENPPDNIYTTVNNIVNETTEIVENVTENVFTTVNNVTENLLTTVNNVTNDLTDIISNILNGNPLGGLGPIGLNLDVILNDLTNLNLDFINGDNILNVLNGTLDLSPVLEPVEGILGDVLADLSLGVLFNPFEYDDSPNDYDLYIGTDLNLLGSDIAIPTLNIPLDPVEFLLGDINLKLDLGNDLLDLPLLGDGLLGLGQNQLGADSDTDITLPFDLALVDSELVQNALSSGLDPLEALIGDIELDLVENTLNTAHDLVGDIAELLGDIAEGESQLDSLLSLIDDLPLSTGGLDLSALISESENSGGLDTGSSLPSWTEYTLPDAGDILGEGLLSNVIDILPDPVSVLPALSNADTIPVLPSLPLVGGVFGGNHGGGGLFG